MRSERRDLDLSVAWLGVTVMRRLNREFTGRDRVTDVLAFELRGPECAVGDVYICPAVARREAAQRRVPLRTELIRLLVHGVLHVLGYEHPDESREASAMWQRQERYVRRFA